MFSHVFVGVGPFDRALAFYGPVLATLGLTQRFVEADRPWAGWQSPQASRPLFIIGSPHDGGAARPGHGQMVAFLASDRGLVDAFHAAALVHGGRCDGPPGLRPHYHPDYYGAYVLDPDGNKLAVACHAPEPAVPAAVTRPDVVRGSCLCDGVAFEVRGPLDRPLYCHCRMCRKAHGTAFRARAGVAASDVRWTRGEDLVRWYESSPGTHRGFCGVCGSNLLNRFDASPEVYGLALGVLDDDPGVRPECHVFVAAKAPWFELSDTLPRFEGLPPRRS